MSTFQLSSVQAAAVAELLRIAPVADRLGELFSNAGHELYLVGGSVRDALLGKLGHDLDFATSARPDAVEKLLRKFSPAVWTIGKEYGTIGCKVEAGDASWVIEVTTYRSDVYAGHSRKPEVAFGDTLEGDLLTPRLHDQRHGGVDPGQAIRRSVRRVDRSGAPGDPDTRRRRRAPSAMIRCG